MTVLCRLDDIDDPGSCAAMAEIDGVATPLMVIRRRNRVYAYVNLCPHVGAPLDFEPGRFLSLDKTRILCSTHGAHFVIESGGCVSGPCDGKGLIPVAVTVADGDVVLA